MKRFTIAWAFLLAAAEAAAGESLLVEGKPLPDLDLPALADGKLQSLASLRGRKTLLAVFASW